jgi:tRNA (guanine37-N1)-methyltransferase
VSDAASSIRFDVVGLFPEIVAACCGYGVVGRAVQRGTIALATHQLRDYTGGSHHPIDDDPYGGGPGMVMRPEPIFAAIEAIEGGIAGRGRPVWKILTTPHGARFDQETARDLAARGPELASILIFCGRYEGIDERVRKLFDQEISLGDFVLTGGEIAAAAIVDAVVRLIPGVLGCADSPGSESFGEEGLLEYPQYTRPAEFRGERVPAVLQSGDHAAIREWRRVQAFERTRTRRPDLVDRANRKPK